MMWVRSGEHGPKGAPGDRYDGWINRIKARRRDQRLKGIISTICWSGSSICCTLTTELHQCRMLGEPGTRTRSDSTKESVFRGCSAIPQVYGICMMAFVFCYGMA